MFPEVVADEPWPYGLVGDEKSEFYAGQLDGDFFADVKNSSFFLEVLEVDAREKQVDADVHLKTVQEVHAGKHDSRTQGFHSEPHGCDLRRRPAHLGLGWQECRQEHSHSECGSECYTGQRLPTDCDFHGYERDACERLFTAVLSTAPPLMAFRSAVSVTGTSIFRRLMAGVLSMVPNVGKLTADSLAKLLDNMDNKMKQEGFVSLVRRAGKGIAIIVDEANLALLAMMTERRRKQRGMPLRR